MTQEAARAALRARQGKGARYDAANAPQADLLAARRGAAYFARHLNQMSDAALESPSLIQGRSRAHIVAEISHQARAIAITLSSLRKPLSPDEAAWTPDAASAVTLPPRALRHLFAHSDVHLNVEFRDLTEPDWVGCVSLGDQAPILVSSIPALRAASIWRAAFYLGTGSRLADMPAHIGNDFKSELGTLHDPQR